MSETQPYATLKTVSGQVQDASNASAVAGAAVAILDTTAGLDRTVGAGTTDAAGRYEIGGVPVGTFMVLISKPGYVDAATPALVRDNWTDVLPRVLLKPVSVTAVIGAAGGTLTDRDGEGDVISLAVPAGALAANTQISMSHLQGLDVPPGAPAGRLSLAAAYFGPKGTTFANPVTVTFPLPQRMTEGTELPLYTLDAVRPTEWLDTGSRASVNPGGLSASVQVSHFSIYALMPEVLVTETVEDTLIEAGERLPDLIGSFTVTYRNRYDDLESRYIHFDSDTTGLNVSTIVQMFEQHHGVSFSKPVTETISYGCWRATYPYKFIRVLVITEQMHLTAPDRTIVVRKRIRRPMIEFPSHDQGGTGKTC